jgi:hypothetical protein
MNSRCFIKYSVPDEATRGSTRGVRPLPPPSAVWARGFSGQELALVDETTLTMYGPRQCGIDMNFFPFNKIQVNSDSCKCDVLYFIVLKKRDFVHPWFRESFAI